MRTADEILHKHAIGKDVFIGGDKVRLFRYKDAILALNEARIEAIKETAIKVEWLVEEGWNSEEINKALNKLIDQVK